MDDDFISPKPAFIGGAEKARRNARKRMRQPPRGNDTSNKRRSTSLSPYPKSMRQYERFFGSLLSSSPKALELSETDGSSHRKVMHQACSLLNVPALPTPSSLQQKFASGTSIDARTHHLIQRSSSIISNASSYSSTSTSSGTYENARSYYLSKAPLILEEARCIISESLAKIPRNNKRDSGSFTLELMSIEEKYPKLSDRQHSPLILNFQIVTEPKQQRSNDRSTRWTRPGSVLLLRQQGQESGGSDSSVLACVVPNGNWQSSSSCLLSLMIFRRDDLDLSHLSMDDDSLESDNFDAIALTTLISQSRQMEACLQMVKVSFMSKLLGQKSATHIRFDSSDEEEGKEMAAVIDNNGGNKLQEGFYVNEDAYDEECSSFTSSQEDKNEDDGSLTGLLAKIPMLNSGQEHAAKSFLNSTQGSLSLVQGPPGTGKSLFLVNVICRRLAINPNARLMVTAPTNKAVTVIAERFLDVLNSGDDDLSCRCRVVLVGVEDKLITQSAKNEAECISAEKLSSSLRSIFVYSFLESLKDECASWLKSLKLIYDAKKLQKLETLIARVEKAKTKLSVSIPSARSAHGVAKMLLQQLRAAAAAESDEFASPMKEAMQKANDLVEILDDMESPVQELLATAQVIFCTLSTAGASLLKQTRRIDDLYIDEAAAATEPELWIPFHLRPQRLLAVGDPLQLPPTIVSRHASDLGLSTSMHERLMLQCGNQFFLLSHQYRMNPQISKFPCKQFYDGKIMNGENVAHNEYTSNMSLPIAIPYSFIDVRGNECQIYGGSYSNEAECIAVVKLVENIAARNESDDWHCPDKLRIITFYSGQVVQLRRLLSKRGLAKVLVATVDSSQGCEADVVIVSFVRSSTKKGVRHAAGFLTDDRRINVAITRARHQLICVGDASRTLSREGSQTLKSLVSDAKERLLLKR